MANGVSETTLRDAVSICALWSWPDDVRDLPWSVFFGSWPLFCVSELKWEAQDAGANLLLTVDADEYKTGPGVSRERPGRFSIKSLNMR